MKTKIIRTIRVPIAKQKIAKRVGRPPTKNGIYDPPRMIGRVSNEDWATLKAAARIHRDRTGESFTEWAIDLLMAEARKLLTTKKSKVN